MINRRRLLAGASLGCRGRWPRRPFCAPRPQDGQDGLAAPHPFDDAALLRAVRAGGPTRSRSSPFDSPTDGKNAVVTKSVDFGAFGIAAAHRSAPRPASRSSSSARSATRAWASIAKAGSDIKTIKDLKGKKVGIWPGSTQEVFILERLRMEGMTIKDISRSRVPFGEMHAMLVARRHRCLCRRRAGPRPVDLVRRRPAGRISLRHRHGRPQHGLRHARGHGRQEPRPGRTMLKIHRQASEFMMANKAGRGRDDGRRSSAPTRPRSSSARRRQCRVHLEADDRCRAGQDLRPADAGAEADPRAAGFRHLPQSDVLQRGRHSLIAEPCDGRTPCAIARRTRMRWPNRTPSSAALGRAADWARLKPLVLALIVPRCCSRSGRSRRRSSGRG